jgi:hypothetical protein
MDVVIVHIATLWPVSEYAYENAAIRAWRMGCLCPAVPVALQDFCGEDDVFADNFLQKTARTAVIASR